MVSNLWVRRSAGGQQRAANGFLLGVPRVFLWVLMAMAVVAWSASPASAQQAQRKIITLTPADDVAYLVLTPLAQDAIAPGVPAAAVTILDILDGPPPGGTSILTIASQADIDLYSVVAEMEIRAGAGDDIVDATFMTGQSVPILILLGEGGDDYLMGGTANDEINGGPGSDIVNGGEGDDNVSGGPGNDLVRGDRGKDTLGGGGGAFDVVDYATDAGNGGVTVSLAANQSTDGWGDQDDLTDDSFAAIRGKNANDTLTGDPDRSTTIVGNGGDDTMSGGVRRDIFIGDGGDDTIDCSANGGLDGLSDIVIGGSGADVITGTNASDIISGDGTADTVTAMPDPPPVDPTVLLVPDGLEDQPWLWPPLGFEPVQPIAATALFPPAPPGNPDPVSGLPPAGTVLVANLSSGADDITAGEGADTIWGCGGGDRINGDIGADTIWGDYNYDSDGDGIFDLGDQELAPGSDAIWGGPGTDLIVGGGGSDILAGGVNTSPVLPGDVISGNSGIDIIIGDDSELDDDGFAAGVPLYLTGDPSDTVDYTAAATGIQITMAMAVNGFEGQAGVDGDLIAGIIPGFDLIAAVENVIGSPGADDITGSDDDLADVRSFNLELSDVTGATVFLDTQSVSGYDNILMGGAGNDTVRGGMGVDAVIGDDFNALTLDGDDVLWGDRGDNNDGGNDTIWGNGGNDTIHGESGDDIVSGGTGADNLSGDAGTDTLDYSEFGGAGFTAITPVQAVKVNLSNAPMYGQPGDTATDGGDLALTIAPAIDTIENARGNPFNRFEILIGSAYDVGPPAQVANPPLPAPEDDILIGHESLPTQIFGLAGDDLLVGGHYNPSVGRPDLYQDFAVRSGNDILNGGPGDDVIMPGSGNDTVIGDDTGETNGDTVSYLNALTGVNVNLANSAPQRVRGDELSPDVDTLLGIENVEGSLFADTLSGNSLPNWVLGAGGDDTLVGGGDTDIKVNNTLVIREDFVDGGTGNDTADYRIGDPAVLSVDLATGVAANDGQGGSDRLFNIENVLLPNNPLRASAGADKTVAAGGSALLDGSATGGNPPYTYAWTPAATLDDATKDKPLASPTETTTYKLTVRDAQGREATDFVVISVSAALVVDAGPARTISFGQGVELDSSVTGGVTPLSYAWSPSEGLNRVDIPKPTASPTVTTTYTLTVTDALGRAVSDTVTVTVVTSFSVSAGSDVSIPAGGQASLNATVNGGTPPYSITWTPATGLSSASVANPTASPAVSTAYTVRVTDATGRQASDTVVVSIIGSGGSGGDGDDDDGSNGQDPPLTSPDDDPTTGGIISSFCGNGAAAAMLLNGLLLLALRRRRW